MGLKADLLEAQARVEEITTAAEALDEPAVFDHDNPEYRTWSRTWSQVQEAKADVEVLKRRLARVTNN